MVSCFERQTQIVREQISGKFLDLINVRQMINVGFHISIFFLTYTVGVPYFVKLESMCRRGRVSRMVKTRNRTEFRSGSDRETFT